MNKYPESEAIDLARERTAKENKKVGSWVLLGCGGTILATTIVIIILLWGIFAAVRPVGKFLNVLNETIPHVVSALEDNASQDTTSTTSTDN